MGWDSQTKRAKVFRRAGQFASVAAWYLSCQAAFAGKSMGPEEAPKHVQKAQKNRPKYARTLDLSVPAVGAAVSLRRGLKEDET